MTLLGNARKAARHRHPLPVRPARKETAQGEAPRLEPSVHDRGGRRCLDQFLRDIIHRAAGKTLHDFLARLRIHVGTNARAALGYAGNAAPERRCEDQPVEAGQRNVALCLLPAPPCCRIGQHQRAAGHHLGQTRQECRHGARFHHTRAGPVRHRQLSRTARVDQTGDADLRMLVEGHRIDVAGIDPAPQTVDPLQTRDGANIQPAVAHGQVAALHQRKAQVAGQMRLLGIALVEPAGGKQADARIGAGAILGNAEPQRLEEFGDPPRTDAGKQPASTADQRQPVLQRIADTGGQTRAVRQHSPFTRGSARQIDGINAQMIAAGRAQTDHPAGKIGASAGQRGGQMAIIDQLLLAVDVVDDMLQQFGPLDQARLQPVPFFGTDQHGHGAQRPWPLALVAGQAKGQAQILDIAVQIGLHAGQIAVGQLAKATRDLAPQTRHVLARGGEDITAIGRAIPAQRVAAGIGPEQRFALKGGGALVHLARCGLRRSSVIGNSPPSSAGGISTSPGVWPNGWNRARRRASASKSFTGTSS